VSRLDYQELVNGIIYLVCDEAGNFMYMGSTALPLHRLENNHRTFRKFGDGETKFRKALESKGKNWEFSAAYEVRCTRERLEYLEGVFLRKANTKYNVDLFPYESSISYGRILNPKFKQCM